MRKEYSKTYLDEKKSLLDRNLEYLLAYRKDTDYVEYPEDIESVRAGVKSAVDAICMELDIR